MLARARRGKSLQDRRTQQVIVWSTRRPSVGILRATVLIRVKRNVRSKYKRTFLLRTSTNMLTLRLMLATNHPLRIRIRLRDACRCGSLALRRYLARLCATNLRGQAPGASPRHLQRPRRGSAWRASRIGDAGAHAWRETSAKLPLGAARAQARARRAAPCAKASDVRPPSSRRLLRGGGLGYQMLMLVRVGLGLKIRTYGGRCYGIAGC